MRRRHFVRSAALGLAAAPLAAQSAPASGHDSASVTAPGTAGTEVVRPPRLRPGGTVGLVSPAGITFTEDDVEGARETFARFGLGVKVGRHVYDQYGYFAGRDPDRAADVAAMFADPEVDAVVTLRGGWGCARMLPHLDMEVVRANPKVLMGFSDVTALLLGVYAQTGLATVHGPNAVSRFTDVTTASFRSVVVDAEAALLETPPWPGDRPAPPRTLTLAPGTASGRLVGGNLTVLDALVGTPYLPDMRGHVLFLEDIGEAIYRVDRMLTHLGQAGALDGLAAVVFGVCNNCLPDSGEADGFTIEEVLQHHLGGLGVPAFYNAAIGHVADKLTVPLGIEAEVDAEAGTIRLLEPAVV
ncbi:MAG: LD-carboxypeptidase [Bacteroidota bacterium]